MTTADEIREMPAGLEMDAAVAKVLGWTGGERHSHQMLPPGCEFAHATGVPCYSTNLGSGMGALHQFCKRHNRMCRVSYDGLEDDVPWHVSIAGARLRDYWTLTDSPGLPGLALACCRAILLAAAGEQPDGW